MEDGVIEIEVLDDLRECRPQDYDLFYFENSKDYTTENARQLFDASWCLERAQDIQISGNYDTGNVRALMLEVVRNPDSE